MESDDYSQIFQEKIELLRGVLSSRGLDALVLRKNPNLTWLSGGRVHVPMVIDTGCFDWVITPSEAYVVTNAIEAPRLKAEELVPWAELKIVDWWEGRDGLLPQGDRVGSDTPGAGRVDISQEIDRLRFTLVEGDIERFKLLGQDAAVALENVIKATKSSDREVDVAGALSAALWQKEIDLVFIGVAGERRAPLYRHPLPTADVLGSRVVASICARRKGLIVSATRIAFLSAQEEAGLPSYAGLLEVEAAMLATTKVGASFSDPVQAAIAAYPANGFEADEWTKHHQGGPTGFLPRAWPAKPSGSIPIALNQPVAWNPTGKGLKVEDTFVVSETGLLPITTTANWPSKMTHERARPDIFKNY